MDSDDKPLRNLKKIYNLMSTSHFHFPMITYHISENDRVLLTLD